MDSLPKSRCWLIENETIIERLKQRYSVHLRDRRSQTLQFYDSFSWQLWFSDRSLYRVGNRLYLCSPDNVSLYDALAVADVKGGTPRFWWELPENMAVLLQPHLKLRALLPAVRCVRTEQVAEIKNPDSKTVVRVSVTNYRHNNARGAVFLKLCIAEPLRGYADSFADVCEYLDSLKLAPCHTNPLQAHFDAFGQAPVPHTAKPRLELTADEPAHRVLTGALSRALQTARMNENGIIGDLDTEFVHDYRVALRSARALLAQLKGVLSVEKEQHIKQSLREISRRTNALRDLDVYLLDEQRYREMVPPPYADALNAMFDDFRRRREKAFAALSRHLQSKAYAGEMARLERDLSDSQHESGGPNAAKPIGELARGRLARRFAKIRKHGRGLHQGTSDAHIHDLRLQCKKLRYMTEFFASLFDKDAVARLQSTMRRLQSLLGDFNDLSVQQQALYDYYSAKRAADPRLGLAIGMIVGEMYRRQASLRDQIVKRFDKFDSAQTVALFESMLNSGGSNDS